MKEDFIEFFAAVARQKLNFRYSLVKMILHTLPHLKPGWKEFQPDDHFSLAALKEAYPHLDLREYRFIHFIERGNLNGSEMAKIIHVHKMLDLDNLDPEFAFTNEELQVYYDELFNSVKTI